VRSVQQALIDMGFDIPSLGASGTFDRETTQAVKRFQREMGLSVDGVVSAETLGAITSAVPPPGHRIERSADYDRLFRDGRLDIAIAIGQDESGSHRRDQRQILSGLRRDGWTRLDYDALSTDDRRRYGLTADRYDPNAEYFTKQITDPRTNEPVDAVIRMVTPSLDGGRSRRSFEQAIEQDEVVYYSGQTQPGSVSDEARDAPAGLRSSMQGRTDDFSRMRNRPDYQVMMLYGSSTERFLPGMRNASALARDHQDTDILATTIPTDSSAGAQHALRFVRGITNRESNSTMLGDMSAVEAAWHRQHSTRNADRARHTFSESGFLSNSANRVVRYAAP
jgi:peptidoglycan hydrolase-like protein with peptidoglycan-binding domain